MRGDNMYGFMNQGFNYIWGACLGKEKYNAKYANYLNNLEFQNNFVELMNVLVNQFKWTGLPESCSSRFFELTLCLNGMACIVNDKELGYMTLGCAPGGSGYNVYGQPDNIYAWGWNGFNRRYSAYIEGAINPKVEAVVCRDNTLAYPFVQYVLNNTRRRTDIMRTLDVLIKKFKRPYFITCDETQESSVKEALRRIDSNQEALISNKSISENKFDVIDTHLDSNVISTVWGYYQNIINEGKRVVGIGGAVNLDKSERLVVDEVNSDKNSSHLNIMVRLYERTKFCEYVKDIFGLDLKVEVNPFYLNSEYLDEGGDLDAILQSLREAQNDSGSYNESEQSNNNE